MKSTAVNVLKFEHFSLSVLKKKVGYQCLNSQNTDQNRKQGRPSSNCSL